MEYYTVEKLRNELEKLCAVGLGNRIVTFPNPDYDTWPNCDYVVVSQIKTDDLLEECIYLQPLPPEEEDKLFED